MTVNGTEAAGRPSPERVDWVDYAKGICIIMVVMMNSVLGVEAEAGRTGFMHLIVAFAKPFRMPDFFMISGLFLPLVINRDWRTYLDRKVVHFAYFYVLWLNIQFAFKAPVFAHDTSWTQAGLLYLQSYIDPFGTLWFIYLLAIFFVVIKATRKLPVPAIWIAAALLETAHVNTGWTVIDEFCARFVYIYTGYAFASQIFALSNRARANPPFAAAALLVWAIAEAACAYIGISEWPVVSLVLGLAGACAVVATGTLLAQMRWLDALRYCGEHSIVIYLAFFLPMAATRTALFRIGFAADHVGSASLIVTVVGVIGALVIWWSVRGTRLNVLFERPAAFWIAPPKPRPAALQAAE